MGEPLFAQLSLLFIPEPRVILDFAPQDVLEQKFWASHPSPLHLCSAGLQHWCWDFSAVEFAAILGISAPTFPNKGIFVLSVDSR